MAAIMDGTSYNNLVDGQKEKIFPINETKQQYGFARREVLLEAGKKYVFSAKGSISQEAKNAGKSLKIYLWTDKGGKMTASGGTEWSYAKSLVFDSLEPEEKKMEIIDIPETEIYQLSAYVYPYPSVGAGTVEWYKLEDADAVDVVVANVSRNKWGYIGLAIALIAGIIIVKKLRKK